jgi:hypothetical protein
VRHGLAGGNQSNCSGSGDLAACLADVRAWSEAHPGHEVVTIYLDKKQGWGSRRRPADLDALLARTVSRERIYAPAELRAGLPSVRAAAERGGWPAMSALRDKVVFVLTGGGLISGNGAQSDYVAERGEHALAFVAPSIDRASEVEGVPAHFDRETASWVVFFNLDKDAAPLGRAIRARHLVARVWGTDEATPLNAASLAQCVNFVAHDRLDASETELHGVLVPQRVETDRALLDPSASRPRF